ncbi:integrase [Verrucomicrobia bacterium LW23]|nr:integrase [Verrucomicrobia bacterium LW23]
MSFFAHNPILAFLVYVTHSALLRQIAYLKAENEILRSRLPKIIQTTPAERSVLVRLGAPLGSSIQEILGIVHYKTFLQWIRKERDGTNVKAMPRKPGRPTISPDVTALILRMAKENAWGYARIGGELKKLGIQVANNTIKKVLIVNGFHPSPWRTKGDWDRFIRLHMETLWSCDFFTKDIWTASGKVTFYVLFFIHVGSRRVHISGTTCNPTGPWVEQQARNLVMDLQDRGEKVSHLLRDGDTKFTQAFDEVFKSEGIKVKKLPRESPNLNAFAERFVQTIKNECLRHFVVFGQRHLEFLLREFASYYNTVRPHQGIANRTISTIIPFPTQAVPPRPEEVQCTAKLGGLLRHYSRKAA